MKQRLFLLLLLVLSMTQLQAAAGSRLVTYSTIPGAELKHDFKVSVRGADGHWQPVETYMVKVKDNPNKRVEQASMAWFSFSGSVEVAVEKTSGDFRSVRVRPLSLGISPKVEGRRATFTLSRPCNISVEADGDIFHNLHLFANPLEQPLDKHMSGKEFVVKPTASSMNKLFKWLSRPSRSHRTVRFAPGFHQIPNDSLSLPSHTTVVVDGAAWIQGSLFAKHVSDVHITGRGAIVPKGNAAGVVVSYSQHISVDGIMTTQLPTGGSNDVTITNVKSISSYGWGDGLNVFASNRVTFDSVLCRNSDDCTTVYATRKGFTGGCDSIVMRHSVLWADVAHPIFIGLHGNPPRPDTIQNVLYDDIDILDQCEQQVDYQGCMAINAGDNNLVRNVTFSNIRVEDFRQGQLVNLRISFNQKYCTAPGKGIENIRFNNITYNGSHAELSIISGYDDERQIKGVTFSNLRINGKLIYDSMPGKPAWYKTADLARFFVGEHVQDIVFEKQGED